MVPAPGVRPGGSAQWAPATTQGSAQWHRPPPRDPRSGTGHHPGIRAVAPATTQGAHRRGSRVPLPHSLNPYLLQPAPHSRCSMSEACTARVGPAGAPQAKEGPQRTPVERQIRSGSAHASGAVLPREPPRRNARRSRSTTAAGWSRSVQIHRTMDQPRSRMASSRSFSRHNASVGSWFSVSSPVYLTLPSNSPITRCRG